MTSDLNAAESFRSQPSQHFDPKTSNEQAFGGAITSYNQPLDISDDPCHQQQRAYDKLLLWCRNKVKNYEQLKTN